MIAVIFGSKLCAVVPCKHLVKQYSRYESISQQNCKFEK